MMVGKSIEVLKSQIQRITASVQSSQRVVPLPVDLPGRMRLLKGFVYERKSLSKASHPSTALRMPLACNWSSLYLW